MSLSNEKSTEVKNPFSIKVEDLKLRGRNRKFPRFEIACERRLEEREIGNKREDWKRGLFLLGIRERAKSKVKEEAGNDEQANHAAEWIEFLRENKAGATEEPYPKTRVGSRLSISSRPNRLGRGRRL